MKLLFLDYGNAVRSQIAAAFYNKYSPSGMALSASVSAERYEGEELSENVVNCMGEKKIDISRNKITLVNHRVVEKSDKVVAMCSLADLPSYIINHPDLKIWNVADTNEKDYDFHRKVRDDIEGKVMKLIRENSGKKN